MNSIAARHLRDVGRQNRSHKCILTQERQLQATARYQARGPVSRYFLRFGRYRYPALTWTTKVRMLTPSSLDKFMLHQL